MDETFAPEEQLYRGLHSIWIEDDNSVSSAAFKDSNGVSVDRDGGRPEQNCIDRLVDNLPQIEGVGKLSSQDVVDSGALPVYLPEKDNDCCIELQQG